MIIMDLKVDNMYGFKNFYMNMSYPKRIVDSTIDGEFLEERPNFRYKKLNIIMGTNATGKTSLGKVLIAFTNYFQDGLYGRFINIISNEQRKASLVVDFVTDDNRLYRFSFNANPKSEEKYTERDINIKVRYVDINKKDNYETCAAKLDKNPETQCITYDEIYTDGWYFTYPSDTYRKTYEILENDEKYIKILKAVLQTLDPSIQDVVKLQEIDNAYAVKWDSCSAIIKDGKISEGSVLSSGTKEGLDISYIIASLYSNKHDFYYCDEVFSYVNSDIEKACLSIMIDKLTNRKQLFFTTHNTEILDMQLPKHTFSFLKKDVNDVDNPVKCINASEYLKRGTDSLKNAVGTHKDMIEAMPNTASWCVNASFLSSWFSAVKAEDLPDSAASFVEMQQEMTDGDSGENGGMAVMG